MVTTVPKDDGTRIGGTTRAERRDPTTRALRNAVAAWFRINPATLATLDRETVELMALRLEGRRPHRSLAGLDGICPVPEGRHPWAG